MTQQVKIEVTDLYKVFYSGITDLIANKKEISNLGEDDKIALNGVNLAIGSGEIIGIIGRNGAGKSTLLSILAGIATATKGFVNIVGKVTAVLTIGIGLREDLTGRENIYIDAEIQGKSKSEVDEVIDEIIQFTELGDFIDRPVKTYSTGMKSRLAFSMLVALEPEILIIDETLSAGDVFFAAKASQKIREICQKGKIVILVSHSMGAIDTMCTRCLWMEAGQIIMDGAPQAVTSAYLKKIKSDDEQSELKIKHQELNNTDDSAGYQIIQIGLRKKETDYVQSQFYSYDSFVLEVLIKKISGRDAILRTTIVRIDGLLIDENEFYIDASKGESKNKQLLFEQSLDSLSLNKGYYEIRVELIEKTKMTNLFTRLFEVKNDHMPSGGAPLLHYPVEIELKNKDKIECLDSIELIAN